jgi:hypothetical protein
MMFLQGKYKTIIVAAILIIATGVFLSSCVKNGVETPRPLSSYNVDAYSDNEYITFNATTKDYYDTLLNMYGIWVTNINYTYILNFVNIRPVKGYKGTYALYSAPPYTYANYAGYVTGSNPPSYSFNFYSQSGSLSISSYDSVNRTITGTFSFTGYQASNQSLVSINNGNFIAVKLTP